MIAEFLRQPSAALLLVLFAASSLGAQGRVQSKLDSGNVQRQDKITQDILTRYLHRRLFPNRPVDLISHNEQEVEAEAEATNAVSSKINWLVDDNEEPAHHCSTGNCLDEGNALNKWSMPLLKLGEKRYYLGIFFKANWYRASQYCRYHGMHLASITSQDENDKLERHIQDFGLGNEHFWTSGTDQAEEGTFFWMSTGRPVTFTNWNTGEPNNFRYENGEEEHCLELWNRDGKGLRWNDSPCSFETYFVCEI